MSNLVSTGGGHNHPAGCGCPWCTSTVHGEAEGVVLADVTPEQDWGPDPNLREGSRSPWGEVQYVNVWAPGVVSVGCAGHGGVKLSAKRNLRVPEPLRNSNGWYEEDCEAYIVGMVHPDAHCFPSMTVDESQRRCEAGVREWFPEQYEQATGNEIPFGESGEKDRLTYRRQARYAIGSDTYRDGNGVTYRTLVDLDGNKQWVLMNDNTAQEYTSATPDGFGAAARYMLPSLVPDSDLNKHRFVDDPRHAMPRFTAAPNVEGASTSSRARVAKDLNKRWRRDDGTISTLREVIETEGMTGKRVTVVNGTRRYYLQQHTDPNDPNSPYTPWQVSKDTWQAFEAPDTRTPADRALEDVQVLSAKVDRMTSRSTTGRTGWRTPDEVERLRVAREKLARARRKWDEFRLND